MAAQPGPTQNNNLVILVEKDGIDQLETMLAPSEMTFLRQSALRDIVTFFFPRMEGGVFIRLL